MSTISPATRARALRRMGHVASRLPRWILTGFIRAYQVVLSPMRGATCRYYPSCSTYALTAVTKHGAVAGSALAAWRVLRCNPFSPGGVDHVPDLVPWKVHRHRDRVPANVKELT